MAIAVRLPKLGKTMVDGTVVSMNIKEGDHVSKGDVIFEIETDKATLEVESLNDGFVKRLLIGVGETIAVDTTVAVLGGEDEEVAGSFIEGLRKENAGFSTDRADELFVRDEAHLQCGRALWSCLTNEQADEDISKAGVEEFNGKSLPLSRLQKLLGKRMVQSKRNIPCFYLTAKVDVTDIAAVMDQMNNIGRPEVSIDDFVVCAIAKNFADFPVMTGQLGADEIRLADEIGVGVVMEVDEGAVSPVIRNADTKSVRQISESRFELMEKARNRRLSLQDLEGGCISLTNTGSYGIDMFIPVVIPGQCSIVGIGRVNDELVPGGRGKIDIRKIMKMTIAVDHRIANGADARQFLDHIKKMLENTENFV